MKVTKIQLLRGGLYATDENGFVWVKHNVSQDFKLLEVNFSNGRNLMDELMKEDK